MADVGRHVRVTGLVQGVFFRAWAHGQARELRVRGWIRNCPDGSVEAHVSGAEDAVDRMVARMGRGPSSARVQEIVVEHEAPQTVSQFEIRH